MKGAQQGDHGGRVEAMVAYVLAHRERLEGIGKGALTFSFAGGSLAVEVKEVEPQIGPQISQISQMTQSKA